MSGTMVSLGNAFNLDQQVWPEHHHMPGAVPGAVTGEKNMILELDALAWGGHVEKERER